VVFITEMKSVYSAVRTGPLNQTDTFFVLTGLKYMLDLRSFVVFKPPEYGTLVPANVGVVI